MSQRSLYLMVSVFLLVLTRSLLYLMVSTSGWMLACSSLDSLMFVLVVYGVGVVLVLACCSFNLLAFRSVGLFVLVIDGIGARVGARMFFVRRCWHSCWRRPCLPLVASALCADVLFG